MQSRVRSPFNWIRRKDRALHSYALNRFPRATSIIDRVLAWLLRVLESPIFALVLGLLLGVLGVTGLPIWVVVVSFVVIWLVAVVGIAKRSYVKSLSIPTQTVTLLFIGFLLAFALTASGKWLVLKSREPEFYIAFSKVAVDDESKETAIVHLALTVRNDGTPSGISQWSFFVTVPNRGELGPFHPFHPHTDGITTRDQQVIRQPHSSQDLLDRVSAISKDNPAVGYLSFSLSGISQMNL